MKKTLFFIGIVALTLFASYWLQDNSGQIAGALGFAAGAMLALASLGRES